MYKLWHSRQHHGPTPNPLRTVYYFHMPAMICLLSQQQAPASPYLGAAPRLPKAA